MIFEYYFYLFSLAEVITTLFLSCDCSLLATLPCRDGSGLAGSTRYLCISVMHCSALMALNISFIQCSCVAAHVVGGIKRRKNSFFFLFFSLLPPPLNLSWPSASYMRKTTACLLPANLGKEQRGSRSQVKTTDLQVSPYPLKFSFLNYSLGNVSNHLACIMKVRSGTH